MNRFPVADKVSILCTRWLFGRVNIWTIYRINGLFIWKPAQVYQNSINCSLSAKTEKSLLTNDGRERFHLIRDDMRMKFITGSFKSTFMPAGISAAHGNFFISFSCCETRTLIKSSVQGKKASGMIQIILRAHSILGFWCSWTIPRWRLLLDFRLVWQIVLFRMRNKKKRFSFYQQSRFFVFSLLSILIDFFFLRLPSDSMSYK